MRRGCGGIGFGAGWRRGCRGSCWVAGCRGGEREGGAFLLCGFWFGLDFGGGFGQVISAVFCLVRPCSCCANRAELVW